MKLITFFTGLCIFLLTSNAQNDPFTFEEEGLCIEKPESCPNRIQKYGICCTPENSRAPREFQNYCQGCQAVIYIFIGYRAVILGG